MNEFLEKWKTDKKFKTKIQLLLYTAFVVVIAIFAISSNNQNIDLGDIDNNIDDGEVNNTTQSNNTNENAVITIPESYDYEINITIDEQLYKYYGNKTNEKTTITKEVNSIVTNYIYEDNNYYLESDETFILTSKDEVYDVINYNYINLENINIYLTKAVKNNDQYNVYLKDIILGNDSEEYITITINEEINIDYTALMKLFNNNIENYKVNIKIEEKNGEVN